VTLLFVYGFILFTVMVLSFTGSKMLPKFDLGRVRELPCRLFRPAELDHRAEEHRDLRHALHRDLHPDRG
jgi:hypothetical protein